MVSLPNPLTAIVAHLTLFYHRGFSEKHLHNLPRYSIILNMALTYKINKSKQIFVFFFIIAAASLIKNVFAVNVDMSCKKKIKIFTLYNLIHLLAMIFATFKCGLRPLKNKMGRERERVWCWNSLRQMWICAKNAFSFTFTRCVSMFKVLILFIPNRFDFDNNPCQCDDVLAYLLAAFKSHKSWRQITPLVISKTIEELYVCKSIKVGF